MTDWHGRRVIDPDDRYLGMLEEIYLDDDGEPTRWAVLDTGVGPQSRSFVPLSGASLAGQDLQIAYSREQVLAATEIEPDGELTAAEEERLMRIYDPPIEMVRSEEKLQVSTEVGTAGRVRLRKVVVSEDVTVTVTLRREEIRLEPIIVDADALQDTPATLDDSDEVLFEVTLHEEVPVVGTRVVPREHIRLRKILVTDEREVIEPVRAERFELTDDRPGDEISPMEGGQP